jgi:hypothetical protein
MSARRPLGLLLAGPAPESSPIAVDESPLFVSSFARGLQVLMAFGPGNPSMSLAELAEVAGMTRSAAQRFVFTLEALGYLRKEITGRRYHLTPKTLELGMRYVQTSSLVERANPYLHELNRTTGESCGAYSDRHPHADVLFVRGQGIPVGVAGGGGRNTLASVSPGSPHGAYVDRRG